MLADESSRVYLARRLIRTENGPLLACLSVMVVDEALTARYSGAIIKLTANKKLEREQKLRHCSLQLGISTGREMLRKAWGKFVTVLHTRNGSALSSLVK